MSADSRALAAVNLERPRWGSRRVDTARTHRATRNERSIQIPAPGMRRQRRDAALRTVRLRTPEKDTETVQS
eukprot:9341727-Pyramimonas_sp.AAC.1